MCLPGGPIKSGHRLVAKDGSTILRMLEVPTLSIDLDRATDVLRVHGPGGADLHFVLDSCIPGYITCYGNAVDLMLQPSPSTGKYQTTLGYDARGGDRVRLEWNNLLTTDFFERLQTVPYLQVERGSSRVQGGGKPGTTLHAQLRRSDGTVRGPPPTLRTRTAGRGRRGSAITGRRWRSTPATGSRATTPVMACWT